MTLASLMHAMQTRDPSQCSGSVGSVLLAVGAVRLRAVHPRLQVRVGTVDDFQGQEARLCFISTTLSRPPSGAAGPVIAGRPSAVDRTKACKSLLYAGTQLSRAAQPGLHAQAWEARSAA